MTKIERQILWVTAGIALGDLLVKLAKVLS